MPLEAGIRLGHYEILSPIGAGGMGEVYKAKDTRLDRTVAIKVLPEHIAKRPDLRARFEREARAVASLNHPHICVLHDIGSHNGADFMVMEYMEGETLSERIAKGALPLDQALKFATQTSDALDRAHRAGVTHRDVKPSNIMLTRDGVKVLDFGLAKSAPKTGPTEQTLTAALTTEGSILGTPQYMAPEQFEGKEADARCDIWAFGGVVYEMVTGEKAFKGKNYTSLVGAILSADPPQMSVKPFTPPSLERLVRRCLAKDPEDRYQSMRDVVLDLRAITDELAAEPAHLRSRHSKARRSWVAWAVAGALALVAAAGWLLRPAPPADPPPAKVDLQPVERDTVLANVSVSPDGESIVWRGRTTAGDKLYWRSLSTGATRAVADEGGTVLAWSPDSRSFLYAFGGKLKRVDLAGGAAQVISDGGDPNVGAGWGQNGILLGNAQGPLLRVPVAGGTPAPLLKLDQERGETRQRYPVLLPDGRLLYSSSGRNPDSSGIYITPLDGSQKPRRVHPRDGNYRYIHPGRLIVRHAEGVALGRVDLDGGTPPGEPVLLDPSIVNLTFQTAASLDGKVIALLSGGTMAPDLSLLDRTGKKLAVVSPGASGLAGHPDFSPDGKRIAFETTQGTADDVWVFDIARQATSRLTFAGGRASAWSADGNRLFYYSSRSGKDSGIYEIGSNGVGTEKQVAAVPAHHMHASPDGKVLAFEKNSGASGGDLWAVSMDGKGKLEALLTGQAFGHPRVSPDSHFLAYSSAETGRREVYIQTMPPGGGKWQVSTGGGTEPKWRADGKELYFLAGDAVMAAAISLRGSAVEVGGITELFQARRGTGGAGHFAVSPDGKFFALSLVNERAQDRPVTLLLNWKLP